jgi:hypothetical protein
MSSDETIHRARRNGDGGGQYVAPGERSVSVDLVVDLLVSAATSGHTGVRRAANALLDAMEHYGPWRILAATHEGGRGMAARGPDRNAHITLRVGNIGYHLQTTVDGHVRRITGDANVELVPPWLPPGAPIPGRRQ